MQTAHDSSTQASAWLGFGGSLCDGDLLLSVRPSCIAAITFLERNDRRLEHAVVLSKACAVDGQLLLLRLVFGCVHTTIAFVLRLFQDSSWLLMSVSGMETRWD